MSAASLYTQGAVEGVLDEVVLRRLGEYTGIRVDRVYGKKGKPDLRGKIGKYNQAARFSPWVVLVDLDDEFECAPSLRAHWLPTPSRHMCFRVAVREIESWLLADRASIAQFLGVAERKVPSAVDNLDDPKQTIITLARASRRSAIREDMVPRQGSGASVGPAYTARMIEFVSAGREARWRPGLAAHVSPSLARCIDALAQLHSACTADRAQDSL